MPVIDEFGNLLPRRPAATRTLYDVRPETRQRTDANVDALMQKAFPPAAVFYETQPEPEPLDIEKH